MCLCWRAKWDVCRDCDTVHVGLEFHWFGVIDRVEHVIAAGLAQPRDRHELYDNRALHFWEGIKRRPKSSRCTIILQNQILPANLAREAKEAKNSIKPQYASGSCGYW